MAATSEYGGPFVAALQRGDLCATQFHPEKSGAAGLDLLRGFLEGRAGEPFGEPQQPGKLPVISYVCYLGLTIIG